MASDPAPAPLFFDGGVIEGRVLLDLGKTLKVQEVLVKVRKFSFTATFAKGTFYFERCLDTRSGHLHVSIPGSTNT